MLSILTDIVFQFSLSPDFSLKYKNQYLEDTGSFKEIFIGLQSKLRIYNVSEGLLEAQLSFRGCIHPAIPLKIILLHRVSVHHVQAICTHPFQNQ